MATESHSMEEWYNLPDSVDGSREDIDKFAAVRGVTRAENETGEMLEIHFAEANSELQTAIIKLAILGGYEVWRLHSASHNGAHLELIPPFVASFSER
jgi:hypothetical protein